MSQILRKEYPALDTIMWDTKSETITPERAFQLYERRWKYIDQKTLSKKELDLIERLKIEIGKGIFFPS